MRHTQNSEKFGFRKELVSLQIIAQVSVGMAHPKSVWLGSSKGLLRKNNFCRALSLTPMWYCMPLTRTVTLKLPILAIKSCFFIQRPAMAK